MTEAVTSGPSGPSGDKQMEVVKEESPEDPTPCADLHDPKLLYIKKDQEGVFISLGGEQFRGNEEIHAFKFSVTATAMKSEDDKHSPLHSQLYQDQIKDRELPEENNSRESIMIEDHGDGSNSLEPEDTEKDEDYDDTKHSAS